MSGDVGVGLSVIEHTAQYGTHFGHIMHQQPYVFVFLVFFDFAGRLAA